MGFFFVAYLVAHARGERELPSVFQLRDQLAFEDVDHVSALAPVVGAVPGGVLDDSHAGVAGFDGVPEGHSGLAGLLFGGDLRPVGGRELGVLDQHSRIVTLPPPPYLILRKFAETKELLPRANYHSELNLTPTSDEMQKISCSAALGRVISRNLGRVQGGLSVMDRPGERAVGT